MELRREFPIPKKNNNQNKGVDFLIVDRNKKLVIALEVKYKKLGKPLTGSLTKDIAKLMSFGIKEINDQITEKRAYPIKNEIPDEFDIMRGMLFVTRENDIVKHFSHKSKKEDDLIRKCGHINYFNQIVIAAMVTNAIKEQAVLS